MIERVPKLSPIQEKHQSAIDWLLFGPFRTGRLYLVCWIIIDRAAHQLNKPIYLDTLKFKPASWEEYLDALTSLAYDRRFDYRINHAEHTFTITGGPHHV